MTTYLLLPGLGNSGPKHWQSHFEAISDNCHRVVQDNWNAPVCADWIARLDEEVVAHGPENVVLIAHSLACVAVAHWAGSYQRAIKGALLVGPADPEGVSFTEISAQGFSPVPLQSLTFPTIIVNSSTDPWVQEIRARQFAEAWGAEFVDIGPAGHISTDDGYGHWSRGWELLKSLG